MDDSAFTPEKRDALHAALRRGDIRALDALGLLVTASDVETANAQHAVAIGRGVETFTELDIKQAFLNWILAGSPGRTRS